MTNTAATANTIAASIANGTITADDLDALQSDEGLTVTDDTGTVLAWHRPEDNTVAVWEGNDTDEDMTRLVEVKVGA